MLGQSINSKQEEEFVITQKTHALYYELNNPTELKAIEIDADLYRAKFYFSGDTEPKKKEDYTITEERRRRRGVVSSAIYPPFPEMGSVLTCNEYMQISGMKDYLSMPASNKDHIAENFCIAEQLHVLEWILTKARNSGILPKDLYEKIRIDVRHRVGQLQEIATANQYSYEQVLDEVQKNYVPDANFKRILTSSDTDEFAGQIVAYLSNAYYFSNGEGAVTLPANVPDQKVRFAKITLYRDEWQGGELGYDMDCFLKPEGCGGAHALIDRQISCDSALAMRLATVQELAFLKATIELDQGRLGYREKEKDIKMLADKISEKQCVNELKELDVSDEQMALSTFGQESNTAKRLMNGSGQKKKEINMLAEKISQLSISNATGLPEEIFTVRNSADIPPFMPCPNGLRDWNRESENKDKSELPKPSKVYLITGGDRESREQKAYDLAGEDGFEMYAVYHNMDKSEYAVVFSCNDDTFNLMNFDLAKKLAGQEPLPSNFSTNIFGGRAQFGIINLNRVPELDKVILTELGKLVVQALSSKVSNNLFALFGNSGNKRETMDNEKLISDEQLAASTFGQASNTAKRNRHS